MYLQAVPYYDLLVVVRESNVSEAYSLGAKKVNRVFMSADEVAHRPRLLTNEDYIQWANDVLFILIFIIFGVSISLQLLWFFGTGIRDLVYAAILFLFGLRCSYVVNKNILNKSNLKLLFIFF